MHKQTKVIVGISGGVDSSVAAYLLKEAGYDVHGLFMKNWEEDDTSTYCSAEADIKDAKTICKVLDIPFQTMNFSFEYWENVFEDFLSALQAGFTPNPDILCNKEIKFRAFLDYALTLGADYIATGHYARKVSKNNHHYLLTGLDDSKDQSYFLHQLNQEQLKYSLFPLGDYQKSDIRAIAKKLGLITHNKKDSTGICFIGERKFKEFLQNYLPAKPGKIVTEDGEIIGQHDGLMYYTLGQRKGLGIGGTKNRPDAPWFVVEKRLTDNTLIVAQGTDHPALFKQSLTTQNIHWIDEEPDFPYQCQAKTRYRQNNQDCTIERKNNEYYVTFSKPQRAITPGQSVVFYKGDECLGGGVITS